jgi:hypothetical protein
VQEGGYVMNDPGPGTTGTLTDWRADTLTSFPAIRDDTPAPEALEPLPADEPQPCPCGSGQPLAGCDGRPAAGPGTGALLSCAAGVTSRMWRTRVANGQWQNIPDEFDQAHARVHMPALNRNRAIRDEVSARRHDIAAIFTQNEGLLSDPLIADGLHDLEARLAERLADMQAYAEERGAAA